MGLNFGSEYKDFRNALRDFCKKYSGVVRVL